jgi:hypothetical protein
MRRAGKAQVLENRKKEVIRLQKRYNDLLTARRALPLVPLKTPIRYGWERTFTLREDIKKSPKGKFLESLLTKINNKVHCKTKDFVEYDYKTGKMKPIEQHLSVLDPKEYEKLTPQEQAQFNKEYRQVKYWLTSKTIEVYAIKQPWRFVFKIRPSYITHEQMVDGDIESELDKLSDKLWHQGYAFKYGEYDRGGGFYEFGEVWNKINKKIVQKELKEWTE